MWRLSITNGMPLVLLSNFQHLNSFPSIRDLSEMMLNLSLEFSVPASLEISDKYNITICLWINCFYRLLENLHRSSLAFKFVLEYLKEVYLLRIHLLHGSSREEHLLGLSC